MGLDATIMKHLFLIIIQKHNWRDHIHHIYGRLETIDFTRCCALKQYVLYAGFDTDFGNPATWEHQNNNY